jgi:hypothetical protein
VKKYEIDHYSEAMLRWRAARYVQEAEKHMQAAEKHRQAAAIATENARLCFAAADAKAALKAARARARKRSQAG